MIYQRIDTKNYKEIMDQYHIGSLLAKVLVSMNYSEDELLSFFNPCNKLVIEHESLFKIKEKLIQIKQSNQKVFIYGDYDCDGLCSTTLLVKILNKLEIPNGYYIPDRFKEGYGLSLERVKQAKEKGYQVVICVDNGVAANDQLQWAKDNGMDTIVIDHHQIDEEVKCDILLHPTLLDKDYQYLCATGLVYLLANYLNIADEQTKVLAMVATIADMMEIKGINTKIINDGINSFNNHPDKHLIALSYDLNMPINEDDIGFKITPKINSVGRLSDKANPNNVVKFFLSDDYNQIRQLSLGINQINELRKELSNSQSQLVISEANLDEPFILYYSENLHEGLCGLVANKIANAYNKPCIIFSSSNGILKGSGRGIEGLDLYQLLSNFKDHALTFGGHKLACGISIDIKEFDNLKQYIKDNYIPKEAINEYLLVDNNDLTYSNLTELFNYRPFGQGRKLPLMGMNLNNFTNYQSLKNENQLKWQISSCLSVVSFFNNKGYQYYLDKTNLFALGKLSTNLFNNRMYFNIVCDDIVFNDDII